MASNQDNLSANKRALLKIRELKKQLEEQQNASEPIAVVSMACRFPKTANTPEKFWDQLLSKESFVSDIPDSRWDLQAFFDEDQDAPGKMYTQKGVYLDSVDEMDPEFFGISPREAVWVDPQQRLLLEVAWEAIERAGWLPEDIGDSTGVFVGWMHNDYQNEASDSFLNLNPYIATGAAGSFLSGRLAYYLGLNGPALAVDTACSSSLVALHLAILSLQKLECDQAVVGGVNVICSPTTNILTCKLKALSPSGHSRAFDASADGYLRGEGCGVVTLKRLSDAEAAGDNIVGVIKGSAVGHNGFSSGLTAPNPKAQEQVIRQAIERAGISAEDVDYLEAHGTGTELGDPLEVQAAMSAYCQDRSADRPLLIGSVKTNIGHLEAAAGMAGLIKVLMALQQNDIPGQLNFETPNPHIPWETAPIKVLTEATPWPHPSQKLAGVSAFGMSGTNAHVVVEGYQPSAIEPKTRSETTSGIPKLITVSGHTEDALYANLDSYVNTFADSKPNEFGDLAIASNVAKRHHDFRAAVVAVDQDSGVETLRKISRAQKTDLASTGVRNKKLKSAWQFTGQGSQYVEMAHSLYQAEPIFQNCIEQCDAILQDIRGESLKQVLFEDQELVHDTYWTQPAIFAVQMGLSHLLTHWGVQPDFVFGHSVGQYAAACVAGSMSWSDGLRLIAERGRVISSLPRDGKMVAIFANQSVVEELLQGLRGVEIGAFNVSHIVASGDTDAVEEVASRCSERNITAKVLNTSHAFHSHLMDPILDEFASFANEVEFHPCHTPLICNVTGEILAADFRFDGNYWANHIRSAVQYQASLETALESGCHLLVELGPKPVLTGMARMLAGSGKHELLHCLNDKTDDLESTAKLMGSLYVHGVDVDFQKVFGEQTQVASRLPTYQFQRRRFWGPDKPRADHADHHTAHPLLGSTISLAGDDSMTRFQNFVDQDSPSWMSDHEVMESIVMPGAGFIEMAIAAFQAKSEPQNVEAFELTDVRFERPLNLAGRTELQTVLKSVTKEDETACQLETYAKAPNVEQWTRHFQVEQIQEASDATSVELEELQSRIDDSVDVDELYEFLASIDLTYGNQFQTIDSLCKNQEEILVKLVDQSNAFGYLVSPTLLDGALHSLAVGLSREGNEMFLPVGVKKLRYYAPVQEEVWSHATWLNNEGPTRTANLTLYSSDGKVLVEIEELIVQRIDRASLRRLKPSKGDPLVHTMSWQKSRLPGNKLVNKKWLIVGSTRRALDKQRVLKTKLEAQDHDCQLIFLGDNAADESGDLVFLNLTEPNAWRSLEAAIRDFSNPEDIDGIIWVLADDDSWQLDNSSTQKNCEGLISFVQRWRSTGRRQLSAGLQLVTEYANPVSSDQIPLVHPHQTQYWGLGRVMAAECPEYKCRLIDQETTDDDIDSLVAVLLTESEEGQISLRNGDIHVPRIVRPVLDAKDAEAFQVRSDAAYLITGGLGKLGRQAALWLAQNGASEVVLVSRREPDEETRQFLKQIEEFDCRPIVYNADLTCGEQVESLIDKFGKDFQSLGGIIHSAGVLDDGLIENQTWEKFEKVLRPKSHAAWNLHEQSLNLNLDFFILYSSVASTLGSPGQSNYATGNAFLDGLSDLRRHMGLPSLTINWGPWSEGMADDERVKRRLEVQGITALNVDNAHAAMQRSLSQLNQSHAIIIDVDWRKLKLGADGKTPRLLSELVSTKQKAKTGDSQLVAKLKKLPPEEQLRQVTATVQGLFQEVLASDSPPETDRPLIEMGLDSLMAVEFGSSLQIAFGDQFELGPSLLFDHPTIDSIGEYLCSLIAADSKPSDAGTSQPASAPVESETTSSTVRAREDIAIIGMSCRFPGAENYEEYWNNLLNKVDSISEIPADRWDIDQFYSDEKEPGKMHTRFGGFLDGIDQFDARFFNISDNEACWIDPQHRLLLENCYHALEDAGIPTKPMPETNVGVFMGIMGQDYAFLPSLEDQQVIEKFEGAGLSHSAGVGRISYLLGLEGPSVSIDTASSSSLVAVIQAVRSLQDGHCNLALAGGVNAILAPVNFLLMSKAGLLAPDGRCKSFSAEADGFGRGEGCGVVALKRVSDAEKDGDTILAIIRGGAVAHNGFTGGLTTPSSKAQVRVIESAIADAGLSPSDIQYLEAHGTGTEFGDPIEMSAAAKVYGKGRSPEKPLIVGSAKANIGHLEAAGGVSGLIKAVLAIHREIIPPQNHFDSPSRHIPWKRMPVEVPVEPRKFDSEHRYAAVTALGLAGTNAHIVISNWQPNTDDGSPPAETKNAEGEDGTSQDLPLQSSNVEEPTNRKHALFVSASSERSMIELLERYQKSLSTTGSFAALAHRSGVSRRHLPIRECIVASDAAEATAKINELLQVRNSKQEIGSQNGLASKSSTATSSKGLSWIFSDAGPTTMERLQEAASLSSPVVKLHETFDKILNNQNRKDLASFLAEQTNQSSKLGRFVWYATLANLFQHWGIEPDGVAGQLEGQLAAACVCGVLSWEDAFSLALYCDSNLDRQWRAAEDNELDAFEAFADQFNFYPPHLNLYCAITGQEIPVHRALGGSYWRELLESGESPMGIQGIGAEEHETCISFGNASSISGENEEFKSFGGTLLFCETDTPDPAETLYSIVSYLYTKGLDLDFQTVNGDGPCSPVSLPQYPFDRKRYWITDVSKNEIQPQDQH